MQYSSETEEVAIIRGGSLILWYGSIMIWLVISIMRITNTIKALKCATTNAHMNRIVHYPCTRCFIELVQILITALRWSRQWIAYLLLLCYTYGYSNWAKMHNPKELNNGRCYRANSKIIWTSIQAVNHAARSNESKCSSFELLYSAAGELYGSERLSLLGCSISWRIC